MSDNNKMMVTRRAALRGTAVFAGGLYTALNVPRPLALAAMENSSAVVLTATQWVTVEAITARIVPTDHQGGAKEANCVNFIDKALANEDSASAPDFRFGLSALDLLCSETHGKPFADLSQEQQDSILVSLESGSAEPWPVGGAPAADFFELVRVLTIMGFMADPNYGGNNEMIGWQVARYPGPRHHQGGYTSAQMLGEEAITTLWGDEM